MRNPTNTKLLDLLILLTLLYTSCTGSAPEIVDVVYQIGYRLNGRLLRPARVGVVDNG